MAMMGTEGNRLTSTDFTIYTNFINMVKVVKIMKYQYDSRMSKKQMQELAVYYLGQFLPTARRIKIISEADEVSHSVSSAFLVSFLIGNNEYECQADMTRSAEPRLLKGILRRGVSRVNSSVGTFCRLLVAPYISSQAAQICIAGGLNYLDFSGNCHFAFGEVYVHVEGRPNRYPVRTSTKSILSASSEASGRALRIMLAKPQDYWNTRTLAMAAAISFGAVSKVRQYLDESGWLEVAPCGFRINNPIDLLAEWAKVYNSSPPIENDYFFLEGPSVFEHKLADYAQKNNIRYALTEFSGAARYRAMVKSYRATTYLDAKDVEAVAQSLGLEQVPFGDNITIRPVMSDSQLFDSRHIDAVQVVSPVQIALDLLQNPQRGEEAALAVLREEFNIG